MSNARMSVRTNAYRWVPGLLLSAFSACVLAENDGAMPHAAALHQVHIHPLFIRQKHDPLRGRKEVPISDRALQRQLILNLSFVGGLPRADPLARIERVQLPPRPRGDFEFDLAPWVSKASAMASPLRDQLAGVTVTPADARFTTVWMVFYGYPLRGVLGDYSYLRDRNARLILIYADRACRLKGDASNWSAPANTAVDIVLDEAGFHLLQLTRLADGNLELQRATATAVQLVTEYR